ncbi:MAG: efflux RND transporter periplasmic adaptor subunit [Burkholderiales bacterium]
MPLAARSNRHPHPVVSSSFALTPRAFVLLALALALAGCEKEKPKPAARPPVEVTTVTVTPKDTPVAFDFVGQTQSSREVEIRARVDGFLERRVYIEGDPVQAGQTMFLMDRKPFEATLQQAKGELAQRQAQLDTAKANLARVKPLAEQNAVSKKDLDDAVGAYQSAEAQVLSARGNVRTAELNLSYTTIASPLNGLSSFAKIQDGAYVSAANSLLTYVAQLDPIWVNYSVSENEVLRFRDQSSRGLLRFPPDRSFAIELVLADGTVFPNRGRISFADPSFSKETGTFLVRAVLANPRGILRPGQFVRVRAHGAIRPNAILVPQRSVVQGAKSHFVWVIGKDGKAQQRVVDVGEWHGKDWFISQGLQPGEQVVVDGAIRLAQGAEVKIVQAPTPAPGADAQADATAPDATPPLPGWAREAAGSGKASESAGPAARDPTSAERGASQVAALGSSPKPSTAPPVDEPLPATIFFSPGSSTLTARGQTTVTGAASYLKGHPDARVDLTGYTDRTGKHAGNIELAKERAKAVRQALYDRGVKDSQINMAAPVSITGSGNNRDARRVEINLVGAGAASPETIAPAAAPKE